MVACPGDIGAWQTGQDLVAAALGAYGQLDILVNNAGLVRDRMVFSMSEAEWDLVIRVHLRGHFVTTRFATEHWRAASKAAGGPVYARIINTSSEAFLLGSPGQPNYAAAKAGITALTLSTARGCARYGVRANAICPRGRTAMTAALMGDAPAGDEPDPMAPEHVAPLVTYLASPAAAGINGEVFVVHGGVAAVMAPPRIRATFQAAEHGSADGMWSLEAVHAALGPVFAGAARRGGGQRRAGPGRVRLRGHRCPGQRDDRIQPVKQRDVVTMTDAEVAALLGSARKVQLATINPDGTPHLVTMFYTLIDERIAFWTYRTSQKARNLARDPRLACLVEDGEDYFELRGVSVTGTVRLVADQAGVLAIGRRIAGGLSGVPADALDDYVAHAARKRIGFIVEPTRVVSWDHRKLVVAG